MKSPARQDASPPGRRMGRPTRAETAELDAHLLNVAERHFLAQGFEGTSMDRLALEARASKRTIYHRYPGKHTLFEAVIERALDRVLGTAAHTVEGETTESRLEHMALSMIERALHPDVLALLRVMVAEAGRFDDLARSLEQRSWERLMNAICEQLQIEVDADGLRLTVPLAVAARQFVALTQTPLAMRALMGKDLADLQASAPDMVREAIPLFLHGCSRSNQDAPTRAPAGRRSGT